MDTTIHLYEGPTIQDRPESSETVITDLIAFINQKWSQNHEIILNLDANEALGEESQGIAKLMRECNLVDLQSDGSISCLAHHGYKHAYNDEEHWSTMMVSCQTIMDVCQSGCSVTIWRC